MFAFPLGGGLFYLENISSCQNGKNRTFVWWGCVLSYSERMFGCSGGGQVITLLLNHDLVDEMQICYIPVILGNGIPLFPNQPKESTWKFAGSEAYDSGIVKITYVIG